MRKQKKFIASLLSLILLITTLPTQIFAYQVEPTSKQELEMQGDTSADVKTTTPPAIGLKPSKYVGDGYEVEFMVTSKWKGTFGGELKLTNTSDKPLENWTLKFDLEHEIKNMWNAKIVTHEGNSYIVKNADWNQDLAPGSSINIGFQASWDREIKAPQKYELLVTKQDVSNEDYTIDFKVTSDWGQGFNGEISITNNAEETIEDWGLEFDFGKNIKCFWNAEIVEHENNHYVVKNSRYNANIASNQTLRLGFEGNPGNVNIQPKNIVLDKSTTKVEKNTKLIPADLTNEANIKKFAQAYNENLREWTLKNEEMKGYINVCASTSSSIYTNTQNIKSDNQVNYIGKLSERSVSSVYKLKPKYLSTNFNFDMMAATVTQDDHKFKNVGHFRTNSDLCGMSWETVDNLSHSDLKYPTNGDFTGVELQYSYNISGYTNLIDSVIAPTLTIETNEGDLYYVRLWNYVINRPMDDWEIGISNQLATDSKFPTNRSEGNANGKSGIIEIDFDNLYSGWAPYRWRSKTIGYDENGEPIKIGEWVKDGSWEKVPVNNIKKIMWCFVPLNYNYSSSEIDYLDDSYQYEVDFSQWNVSGNIDLGMEATPNQEEDIRICDDYDDIYNMTPERVIDEYNKLGYTGIVNFYIGASHFYDKKFNGDKMEMLTDYPFNTAFEEWYKDYLKRLKSNNINVVQSISMESVDAPESWWQRAWDGTPATTNWTPTPHLLSFVNYDVKMFYQKYVENLARLSVEQELTPKIQLGEPWWWYIESDPNKVPCFYDSATKYQFQAEKGYPMYEFKSSTESIEGHEDVLYWLRDKNGEFALFLRDSVKQAYPSAQFTVLFFPPSVIDKDRVPMMMSIVNFPKEQWRYPNLDFFMLEDYDYLIENKMDKHMEALTFVQNNLGYSEDKIHYFSGFVLDSSDSNIWDNVNQSLNDGFNQGFAENYVWAYAQVKRDGWQQPKIIFANKPSGNYDGPQDISFSCNEADKLIYTTDGSEPTLTNGQVYTGAIHIANNTEFKVVAIKDNKLSYVMKFDYTIPLPEKVNCKIIVDGNSSDWQDLSSICIGSEKIFDIKAAQDEKKLYLLARGANMEYTSDFYIDIDKKTSTGYRVWAWSGSGADYLIEDNVIYQYTGDGSNWNWTKVGNAEINKNNSTAEVSVNLSDIGLTEPKEILVGYSRKYEDFAPMPGNKMVVANSVLSNNIVEKNNFVGDYYKNGEMIIKNNDKGMDELAPQGKSELTDFKWSANNGKIIIEGITKLDNKSSQTKFELTPTIMSIDNKERIWLLSDSAELLMGSVEKVKDINEIDLYVKGNRSRVAPNMYILKLAFKIGSDIVYIEDIIDEDIYKSINTNVTKITGEKYTIFDLEHWYKNYLEYTNYNPEILTQIKQLINKYWGYFRNYPDQGTETDEANIIRTWCKIAFGNKIMYIDQGKEGMNWQEARVCDEGDMQAEIYIFDGSNWKPTGNFAPIPGEDSPSAYMIYEEDLYKSYNSEALAFPNTKKTKESVIDFTRNIGNIPDKMEQYVKNNLANHGYDIDNMTKEDWEMVLLGASAGYIDCSFPKRDLPIGISWKPFLSYETVFTIPNSNKVKMLLFTALKKDKIDLEENIYFVQGKRDMEFLIFVGATIAMADSAVAAGTLLNSAGITITSGGLAIASGVGAPGGVVIEIAGCTQLAASGVCTIAGLKLAEVAGNANGHFDEDNAKLAKLKNEKMLGRNGTRFTSKTIWQNGKTERIDVENPNPGKRPGDIHYHNSNNTKYRFNLTDQKFYDLEGNLAPNKVQELLKDVKFQKNIDKGLKMLGENSAYGY